MRPSNFAYCDLSESNFCKMVKIDKKIQIGKGGRGCWCRTYYFFKNVSDKKEKRERSRSWFFCSPSIRSADFITSDLFPFFTEAGDTGDTTLT